MKNTLEVVKDADPELEALRGKCSSLKSKISELMKELFLELEKQEHNEAIDKKIKELTDEDIKSLGK